MYIESAKHVSFFRKDINVVKDILHLNIEVSDVKYVVIKSNLNDYLI